MKFILGKYYKFKPGILPFHPVNDEWYNCVYKYIQLHPTANFGYFKSNRSVHGYKTDVWLAFKLNDLVEAKEPKSHLPAWF